MTKTCWEMWGSESKLQSLLFSLTAGSFCNYRQYVLNLLVIWKTENFSFFNCSGSLPFQAAIIKNIQDILLSTSFGEKNQIFTIYVATATFSLFLCLPLSVYASVGVCTCMAACMETCCWWWGTLIFFFSPPCFLWDFDRIIAPWKQRNCFVTEENLSFQPEWMAACRW